MRNRLLRSALGAAFSILVVLGVGSGVFGAKGDAQAFTEWPSVAAHTDATASGAGS